jgi:hypothetical protein
MSNEYTPKEYILKGADWIKTNFGDDISNGLNGTIFDINLACAIACKESLYFWYNIRNTYDPNFIVGRCVLDASGDDPDSPRNPFPRNTPEFRSDYGDDVTNMLIAEANATRKIRGYKDANIVYKGYGIFQYDLQYIQTSNEEFYLQKKWYSIVECTDKLVMELMAKSQDTSDYRTIVRRYNGSGNSAEKYADEVMTYYSYL